MSSIIFFSKEHVKMPKIYLGPMSKNVVDAAIDYVELNGKTLGLIPSRRQIEWDGGYVNKWTTREFTSYVKSKTKNIVLQRDHGGCDQGQYSDDGNMSFTHDAESGFDLIHIDPWKRYQNCDDALNATVDFIMMCNKINKNIGYEVGTEEAIRKLEVDELDKFMIALKNRLGEVFSTIKYMVVQSGTRIERNINTGVYNEDRLKDMILLCHRHGVLSKEHNGDYITTEQIQEKFKLGLDAINIAPEMGVIETNTILDIINNNQDNEFKMKWYDICFKSNKWVKWFNHGYVPSFDCADDLIRVCGHYVFSHPEFINMKSRLNIDDLIKQNITNKIESLVCLE